MKLNLETQLNNEQRQAVTSIYGPTLIIAGAGSGKTRVITYRIAYMLHEGIKQSQILSVTFTNKAANEMKSRIKNLTGKKLSQLTISTFHAFGLTVLKRFGSIVGLKKTFTIYDQTDKYALLKELIEDNKLKISGDVKYIGSLFSNIKTGLEELDENPEYRELFDLYEQHLRAYSVVDFDDLLSKPLKILKENEDVLRYYREKYKFFMVDEFQDTSLIQYQLIKILALESQNICVVGDDDQSIYSWRGANYQNIQNFERDFPNSTIIKLEYNYRSSPIILDAANHLIKHNNQRKTKMLKPARSNIGNDTLITTVFPDDEREEGNWIAQRIRNLYIKHGIHFHDIGILVRTNQQMRYIEEAFLRENLPYQVSGGISFFQRKEIKDLIAYMKIIANPDDNISLLRIINTPRRGIGPKTVETLIESSENRGISLFSLISEMRASVGQTDSLSEHIDGKTMQTLIDFITLIEYYREKILSGREMAKSIKSLIEKINYWGHLLSTNKKPEAAKWKYHNIISLIQSFSEYEHDPDVITPNLFDYLNRITLTTKDESGDIKNGKINLITIHAAKGLEFEVVFIAGVEDGIIPHAKSESYGSNWVEEERRLFYVAITRAKRKLFISACKKRKKMGKTTEASPSPFLEEIPAKFFDYEESEEVATQEEATDYFEQLHKLVGNAQEK